MTIPRATLAAALALSLVHAAHAQIQGPSTGSTPYVLPLLPDTETISVLTVDNTGATPDDVVPKTGGGAYSLTGTPDGMGAFDNGDGSFTLLVSHELISLDAGVRAHGGAGAFVSKWIISKNSLAVLEGEDLMKQVYDWNTATQASKATVAGFPSNIFGGCCSGDLPEPTAFYHAASGLGTTARIFLYGEEGGPFGRLLGTVVTGPDAGRSYVLGKFNLSTNGSGLTGVGGWENALANPFPQDKTIVIGNNDGGTDIMHHSIAVYVGTEADKAGLTNGTLKFVSAAGNAAEIVDGATCETGITNGTAFTLSGTASTAFSRPEDGAWNPLNPSQYYFATTDQVDYLSDGLGASVGRTRLWRLTFTDITNPDLGGTIDLLIDGRTVGSQKVNAFDNIGVNAATGHVLLQEDVSDSAHNGKIWGYNPATFTGTTNTGTLTMIAKHDPARFGDRADGVTTAATAPFTTQEESSGIIDITSIMAGSALHRGTPGEAWYISSDQAHYSSGVAAAQIEGGQIFVLHQFSVPTIGLSATTVAPGGVVTVTTANGPGFLLDWLGVHGAADADAAYQSWRYLSGSTTPPESGLTGAAFDVTMPMTPGTYTLRLFQNDGSTLLATSATVTVQAPVSTATIVVNTTTVAPGGDGHGHDRQRARLRLRLGRRARNGRWGPCLSELAVPERHADPARGRPRQHVVRRDDAGDAGHLQPAAVPEQRIDAPGYERHGHGAGGHHRGGHHRGRGARPRHRDGRRRAGLRARLGRRARDGRSGLDLSELALPERHPHSARQRAYDGHVPGDDAGRAGHLQPALFRNNGSTLLATSVTVTVLPGGD